MLFWLLSPGKRIRFSCTAKQLHRGVSSRNSGRPLGHAALDHTRPTTHAYTSGHTVVVWWHGGVVVPGFAAAAMRCLSLEARLFSRLSSGRVSLSAPSSTPARSFARACVSMDDPEVITATTPQLHPRTRHAHNALGACESLPRSPRGSWTVRLQRWSQGV